MHPILGCRQAVRHQTLTLAFSLVRIQPSQPTKRTTPELGAVRFAFVWPGWLLDAKQALGLQVCWCEDVPQSSGRLRADGKAQTFCTCAKIQPIGVRDFALLAWDGVGFEQALALQVCWCVFAARRSGSLLTRRRASKISCVARKSSHFSSLLFSMQHANILRQQKAIKILKAVQSEISGIR